MKHSMVHKMVHPARKNVDMIVDLQFGSTGKGALAAWLSTHNDYEAVISANMPNAGHTAYFDGVQFVHKALPSGVFGHNLKYIMIGPGAVIDPARLVLEMNKLKEHNIATGAQVIIHEAAVLLTQQMKATEECSPVTKIASTAQGSMVALVEKLMRNPDRAITFGQVAASADGFWCSVIGNMENPPRVVDNSVWITLVRRLNSILAEGAQGYSLGINQGFYPYCTSRECTPQRFLSEMGLPRNCINHVWGTMRTYPIRVGNTDKGTSGPCYQDQKELTWEEVGQTPEVTTVTGRIRRVFTFSPLQLQYAVMQCEPTHMFLNFGNYMGQHELLKLIETINTVTNAAGVDAKVDMVGMGPRIEDIYHAEYIALLDSSKFKRVE